MSKRTNIISVKFSDTELDLIDKMAFKTCRKRSTYIRETSLGYKPKEKPPEDFYKVLKQLRYLNNNLNQITTKAHSLGVINEKDYDKQMRMIRDLVLDMKIKYLLGEKRDGNNKNMGN